MATTITRRMLALSRASMVQAISITESFSGLVLGRTGDTDTVGADIASMVPEVDDETTATDVAVVTTVAVDKHIPTVIRLRVTVVPYTRIGWLGGCG